MIAALLFAATSVQGSVRTVELSRGALIESSDPAAKPFTYWDTSDTFIDGAAPDDNFGGEPVLEGGPSKTILIRFGDLNRVLGSTRKIRSATLFLTIAGGDKATLKSCDRVLAPWNAGPYFTINALINRNLTSKTDSKSIVPVKSGPPRWSATWRHPFAGEGGTSWQQAGANGPLDGEPIPNIRMNATKKTLMIEGLGETIQKLSEAPDENDGIALHFQDECEFFASRSAIRQPRLELQLEPSTPATGPDLSVTYIQRISASNSQPNDGEDLAYKAHIKNVGTAKSGGFSAAWTVNGKVGATVDVTEGVAPGAETTLTIHAPFHLDRTDHRTQTIGLRIKPAGPDAVAENNALYVYQNAKQIDVVIPDSVAKQSALNLTGTHSVEDWAEEQIRIFNDVYAAQSRFSFAPDGAKERVAIQHILLGTERPTDGSHSDGSATIGEHEADWLGADTAFLRSVGLVAGLPDFTTMSFPGGSRILLKQGDQVVNRGTVDLYPGLIGYGDTRYEGTLAGAMALPYEPSSPTLSGAQPLIAYGLLSATDVQVFNSRLDRKEVPLVMPKTTLIKATDLSGRALGGIQLDFFQSKGGQILDGPPTFSLTTSDLEGTALLSNKEGLGPFGKLDSDGGNGTFLIRATSNGTAEWGWLKAWQVIDAASRGNLAAAVLEIHFNLTSGPLDFDTNLAKDRIITDSTNILPAKIAPLVSGAIDQAVQLGGKAGDWVEIDLGRDRTIGEISLIGDPGAFWQKFDVIVYTTGQKLDEAATWARETNWNWTSSNRRDPIANAPGVVSVGYCAAASRIRFIRIVNRSDSTGKLRAIKVTPIKISQ